jgi:hypothetical protein
MTGPTTGGRPFEGGAAVGVSTSLLCLGLVAGAIECFWRSARVERVGGGETRVSPRLWRLTGAALIATALGLMRRQTVPD